MAFRIIVHIYLIVIKMINSSNEGQSLILCKHPQSVVRG